MKWGRITFATSLCYKNFCNIGDVMQTFAVDLIYKEMQIDSEQIIDIPADEISTYNGETVLLPMAGNFQYSRKHPVFPTSKNIIPIFLSVYCTARQYLKHADFWKKYGPIGCRDENTMIAMRQKGYDAYLLGCITTLFPKRSFQPDKPHVFLIDVQPKVVEYIPEKLMKSAEYITHDILIDRTLPKKQIMEQIQVKTKEIYARYYNEATLVVTSRLHAAAPCIAMGIPTIVVKNGFDERFGWLDKFVPLYTPDEYDRIDWNPQPIDLTEHKERLMRAVINLLNRTSDYRDLESTHSFYMDRTRKNLHTPVLTSCFIWLAQYFPALAEFIQKKILKAFSTTALSDKKEN